MRQFTFSEYQQLRENTQLDERLWDRIKSGMGLGYKHETPFERLSQFGSGKEPGTPAIATTPGGMAGGDNVFTKMDPGTSTSKLKGGLQDKMRQADALKKAIQRNYSNFKNAYTELVKNTNQASQMTGQNIKAGSSQKHIDDALAQIDAFIKSSQIDYEKEMQTANAEFGKQLHGREQDQPEDFETRPEGEPGEKPAMAPTMGYAADYIKKYGRKPEPQFQGVNTRDTSASRRAQVQRQVGPEKRPLPGWPEEPYPGQENPFANLS